MTMIENRFSFHLVKSLVVDHKISFLNFVSLLLIWLTMVMLSVNLKMELALSPGAVRVAGVSRGATRAAIVSR